MRTPRSPMTTGSTVPRRGLTTVSGDPVTVPDPARPIHLQFRRFAGCPVCNLHLRSVVRRHHEIEAAGIREVVVFHSPAEELRPHTADLPFAVVADPDKRLYREFGVEQSPRALLDPRAWGPIVRAVVSGTWHVLRGREHLPANSPHGGRLGLPADFLIAPDGQVLATKHGEHAYDQWSVDELLELAARMARTPPPAHPAAAERP
ncbi:peroxiredoxin-like family protein [Streptomyces sp. NPDC058683]|uniref:peroxiredoxin-like family protein n=1 Tax=Streptomyces sp. NPDC058683 TaxID=3346597 RepID=UPI00364A7666